MLGLVFVVMVAGGAAAASGFAGDDDPLPEGPLFDCPDKGLGGFVVDALPDTDQAFGSMEEAAAAGLSDSFGSEFSADEVASGLEVVSESETRVVVEVSGVLEGEPVEVGLVKVEKGFAYDSLIQCQPFDETEETP
jgi:hypothetical protein